MGRLARTLLAAGLLASALSGCSSGADARPVVDRWYAQTAAAVATQREPDPVRTRTWALAWWAAERAVGSGSSAEGVDDAALAGAVHDVLTALVPEQRRAVDDALAATLDGLPDSAAVDDAVLAGRRAAAAVLAERTGDGLTTSQVNTPFPGVASPGPGDYVPTPPERAPGQQAGEGDATPFLLGRVDRFDPGPPPAPGTEVYRRDLAEVRELGRDDSATRTAEQTELARFWGPSLVEVFTPLVGKAVHGLDARAAAGLLSDLHRVSLDAQLAVYDAKYVHLFWRPVTALQQDGDGDPLTPQVPGWLPLLDTPPQPEYPSAHTTIAAAYAAVLTARLGPAPAAPLTLISPGVKGVTRTYARWEQVVTENVDARVWAGVHYRHSDEVGAELGRQVAAYDLARAR